MSSEKLQNLRQQIKIRQTSLKLLDDKIGEQLTKKALLQDLYYDDINTSSLSSNAEVEEGQSLRQSKSSAANASASINSSFLQEEISRVRDYLQKNNGNVTIGETTMFTKQDRNMKKTCQLGKNKLQKFGKIDQTQLSYFSKPVYQQISQDYELYEEKRIENQQKMKFIKTLQQTKRKEIGKYLDQKYIERQKEVQRERQMLRAQLIRQREEKQKKQLQEREKIKRKRVNIVIQQQKDVSIYQIQRNRALTALLKQTQRESRNADKILQKTRNLIFS